MSFLKHQMLKLSGQISFGEGKKIRLPTRFLFGEGNCLFCLNIDPPLTDRACIAAVSHFLPISRALKGTVFNTFPHSATGTTLAIPFSSLRPIPQHSTAPFPSEPKVSDMRTAKLSSGAIKLCVQQGRTHLERPAPPPLGPEKHYIFRVSSVKLRDLKSVFKLSTMWED